jgi:hypothetical protein
MLRKSKRSIASGRKSETDILLVENHNSQVITRIDTAKRLKEERILNRKIWEQMVRKHIWPTQEKMKELIEITSISEIAKAVGVSVVCISKKCKQWDLKVKPPEYWNFHEKVRSENFIF